MFSIKMFPIKRAGFDIDEGNELCIQFHNVEFLENFGKIEKGSKFQYAYADYARGILICGNDGQSGIEGDRNEAIEISFKAMAID